MCLRERILFAIAGGAGRRREGKLATAVALSVNSEGGGEFHGVLEPVFFLKVDFEKMLGATSNPRATRSRQSAWSGASTISGTR